MKWYIVHTYSGYEQKAKAALEERVRSLAQGREESAGWCSVPIERVQEFGKGGAAQSLQPQIFPRLYLRQHGTR